MVREEAATKRLSVRAVLNARLRLGFGARGGPTTSPAPFSVRPFDTRGFAPGVDERKLNQLLDTLETEDDLS